jgi:tRNA(fMet)-specific endonuclease VapC
MTRFMLDTNVVSHILKGDRPDINARLVTIPMADLLISAVTEGETLFGLARRNYPAMLSRRVRQFLLRVDILSWGSDSAHVYADLRASCEALGVGLAPLDMMIAAHAVASESVLVTLDKAFSRVPAPLQTEYWTASAS